MENYLLKINRASNHVTELSELFRKKRPFTYVLERNLKTGQSSTFAKRNQSIANEAAVICGEIVHNLRSAIDHVFWDIVSPFAVDDREKRNIQFPFRETKEKFDETMEKGMAKRVSESFVRTLIDLKPYADNDGNKALYLIHHLNITDKHRLLIPTGNYTRLSSELMREQVPDFPAGLNNCAFGNTGRDVSWPTSKMNRHKRRAMKFPKSGILEQELKVPVDIVFSGGLSAGLMPVVPMLHQFIDVTRKTIEILSKHKFTQPEGELDC